jgi:hypothetical protein
MEIALIQHLRMWCMGEKDFLISSNCPLDGGENCLLCSTPKRNWCEEPGGEEIILSRLVNYSHLTMLCRFGVR